MRHRAPVQRVVIWLKVEDEDVFRAFVKRAGFNGATLARTVGCSSPMISLLARGQRTCTADLAEKIAEALGVPRDVLFLRRVSRKASEPSSSPIRRKAA